VSQGLAVSRGTVRVIIPAHKNGSLRRAREPHVGDKLDPANKMAANLAHASTPHCHRRDRHFVCGDLIEQTQ